MLALGGCYANNKLLRKDAGWVAKIDAAYRAKVGPPVEQAKLPACEVWMRVSYSRAGAGRVRPHYEIASPDTCIKRKGEGFEFPGSITLVYDPRNGALGWDAWREMGYCDDDGRDVWVGNDGPSEDVGVPALTSSATKDTKQDHSDLEVCTWNRAFRDSYPLDFELWTEDRKPLRERLELLQVFRNGELAFKWASSESALDRLFIDGERLSARGMPHLSDFDLRVFAAGARIDEGVLKQEVSERADAFHRRLSRAASAVYEAKLWNDASLKSRIAPVRDVVDRVQREIAAITGEAPPAPIGDGAPVEAPAVDESLLARYRALAGKAADVAKAEADAIVAEVSKKLGKRPEELRAALEKVRRELLDEYRSNCQAPAADGAIAALCSAYANFAELERDLAALDRVVDATLAAIDETRLLAGSLRKDVMELGKQSQLQAELYNQTVASLAKEGGFFDPYIANPAAIGGEAILPMRYSDSTQVFVLSPWTGIPFRPSDGFRTEPSATYAIPILDLVGLRVQWGRGRLSDVRLGTGLLYFEDADTVAAEGDEAGIERASEPRLALQLNAALGVFRAGAAFVPAAETSGERNSKWRLLIGLDLYKLLTGTDLQVAATNL
jgi:hypothetical protein